MSCNNCHEISLESKIFAQLTDKDIHTVCVDCGKPVVCHVHPLCFEAFIIDEEEDNIS